MSVGNVSPQTSGRPHQPPAAGRLSLYWPLRTFLPVPDQWTTRLIAADNGDLMHRAQVMRESEVTQMVTDESLVAQATYFHLPRNHVGNDDVWKVVDRLRLPHSTQEELDHPDIDAAGCVAATHEDVPSTLDDSEDSRPTSALTHVTVVYATASLPASPKPDDLAAAVEQIEELVHTTTRALHAVTGMGYGLPTLASTTLEVLIGLDAVTDGGLRATWNIGHYAARGLSFAIRDEVNDSIAEALGFAELEATQHSARSLIHDLQRQAVAAGRRQGDPRTAVVMAAATCEAWVDLMVGALLWEEGATPEHAAEELGRYRDNKERLHQLLAPRLRGAWDRKSVPALRAWNDDVRLARNRVLHAGGLPSAGLAERSINAMYGFLALTLDRLCSPRVRNRYPVAAVLLANRIGLEARGGWTSRIRDAATEADRDDLNGAFNRWYSVTSQLLLPSGMRALPLHPQLQMVALGDGRTYWIERDVGAALARVVRLAASDAASLLAFRPTTNTGMTVSFDVDISCEAAGDWLPEHNLVPGAALMRDVSTWYDPPAAPTTATAADAPSAGAQGDGRANNR